MARTKSLCTIKTCRTVDVLTKAMCRKHYMRFYRHGSTDMVKKLPNGTLDEKCLECPLLFCDDTSSECLIRQHKQAQWRENSKRYRSKYEQSV